MPHLVGGSVLLAAASGRLLVVLACVHLSLGALSDQVSAHAGNVFKTMTWKRRRGEGKCEMCCQTPSHTSFDQKQNSIQLNEEGIHVI